LDHELARRYLDEFILGGQGPEDLFAPAATYTDPQGQTHTIAEACAMVERFNHAVPDRAVDLQEVIAGPEGIALRWTTRGTFANDGWGVRATGGSFHNYSLAILHVGQDGRLTDTWEVVDFFSFFKQTGALAEVAAA